MARVRFGDVIKEIKINIDRATDNHEFYIAGEHMETENIHLTKRGRFEGSDVGPAFIRLFRPGQVLYGSRRTYLKKVAVADFEGITSNTTFVLETKDQSVMMQELLPFIMLTDSFTEYAIRNSKGSTNPYILFSDLCAYEFELPAIEEQHILATRLLACDNVKEAYKRLLTATDELVKSQFVEMFGDPVKNPMRWPSKPAKQLMTKIGSGATPKGGNSAYIDEGISLIRSMHVYNGRFDYDDLAHINEEQAHALDGVTVENNDVLLNITGASVARCCIVPDDILPARVNQHVCILRCRQNTILPVFVNAMLISDSYQDLLWQYAESAGATRQALTKQQIENLQIILPPIELQKQYEGFKNQADKSKFAAQQALADLTATQKALMRQYLG